MVLPNPLLLRDDAEAAPVAPAVGPAVDPQVGIPGHTNTKVRLELLNRNRQGLVL